MLTKEQISEIVTAELATLIQFSPLNEKNAFNVGDVSWRFSEILETEILETFNNPEVEEAIELYFEWNIPSENESVENLFGQHLAVERMGLVDEVEWSGSVAEDEVNQVIGSWARELGNPDMYLGADMRIHATW